MKTILIDGISIKNNILSELKKEVDSLKNKSIYPHLCVVQIGENVASNIYVGHKQKVAKQLGVKFTWKKFSAKLTFEELKKEVDKLNKNKEVTGIIIQFPLPDSFSKTEVAKLVIPSKDADGINPYNQEIIKYEINEYAPITCTPKGILKLLDVYGIKVKDKNVVVLGRSRIVGNPTAYLLKNKGAKVQVINRETPLNIVDNYLKDADLIISATGAKNIVTIDKVKEGVDIIDVGIFKENGKIRGDTNYKDFIGKAKHITPVPGGVGPMTVAMLMSNVIELAKKWGNDA